MEKNILKPGFQFVDEKEIYLEGVKDIVFFGDVGCTGFSEMSKNVFDTILKIKADLFILLGDIGFLSQQEEFKKVIDFCNGRVKVPVFALPGNHDIPVYSEFFGLPYYAIILDRFAIVCLDNSRVIFEEGNLKFLKSQLEKHPDKRFIVAFHVPPPTDMRLESSMFKDEWQKARVILDRHKDRIECIFSAHIHGFQEYRIDGYRVFLTAGGGAALYNLEKDPLKSHHAIRVDLEHRPSPAFEVMRVPAKVTGKA